MRRASLNHAYRLVWSDVTQAYVAVAENTKSHGKRTALAAAITLALVPSFVGAVLISPAPVYINTDADYTVSSGSTINGVNGLAIEVNVGDAYEAYTSDLKIEGIVNSDVNSSSSSSNSAYGVVMRGNLSGTVNNSGIINATVTGSSGSAYGISVSQLDEGTVNNSGTINATSHGYNGDAYGIYVSSGSGTVTNEVESTINATANGRYADATGIGATYVDGVIENLGHINVSAVSDGGEGGTARATGIAVYNADSDIANSGIIEVSAVADGGEGNAYATGIDVDSGTNIINASKITVSAEADGGEGYAEATGIYINYLAEDVKNSGVIEVSASASGSAGSVRAVGIDVDDAIAGNLINDGAITVTADSLDSEASAHGIYFRDSGISENSFLTNNDEISATATANYDAYAVGVELNSRYYSEYSYPDNGYFSSSGRSPAIAGAFTNSGTIKAEAVSAESSATAVGIAAYGGIAVTGSLTNTNGGSITATATAASEAFAAGIVLSSGYENSSYSNYSDSSLNYSEYVETAALGGTLTNTGTISATANATGSGEPQITACGGSSCGSGNQANAYGVLLHGDLSGSLINDGIISATATATSYSAEASGIHIYGNMDGTISNANSITSEATALDSSATAYGVYVDQGLSGTLTNSSTGTISATANGSYASAVGILLNGDSSSSSFLSASISAVPPAAAITNNGSISATANGENVASAAGIYVADYSNASISNTGNISAVATVAAVDGGEGYANASGIFVSNYSERDISSSGNIMATAIVGGGEGTAQAAGIYLDSGTEGNLTTSGTIAASASASDALAFGVYAGNLSGTIDNSAAITATANGHLAVAIGVLSDNYGGISSLASNASISNVDIPVINNTGTISGAANAVVESGTGIAIAYGVNVNTLGAVLQNSGTISASAVVAGAGGFAEATGLYISDLAGGTVNNSGTISATFAAPDGGEGSAMSIVANGTGTINNSATGKLIGSIGINGSDSVVNNDGQLILKNGVDLANINNTGTAVNGYIAGNYNQSSTGVLHIAAESAQAEGGYSQLQVDGMASIDGKAYVDVKQVNTLAIGEKLASVVNAGTLEGNFTGVNDNSAMFSFKSLVNENAIDLEVIRGITAVQAATASGNTVALDVARVFDEIIENGTSNPGMQVVIDALGNLETQQAVSDSLTQTLPLINNAMTQATFGVLDSTNRVIQSRQEGQHGRSSGDEFLGNKKVWLKPFGSWAKQDSRDSVPGYDADTYGMMFGMDAEISSTQRVGLAFAYSNTDVDGKSAVARQNGDVKSYQLIGYGSHALSDATDLSVQLSFGKHDNQSERQITLGPVGTAKANYDSWSAHVGAALAHTMKWTEKTSFTPSVRADYTVIKNDSYSEEVGGVLALNSDSERTEAFVIGVDGKAAHALTDKATLTANLGVGYDLINDRTSITSSFAGAPTAAFTTNGIDRSPWLTRGGLGLIGRINDTTEISARYDFEVREDFNNQTASVKVRWTF